jgi:SAM-dependent methyltransferase
LARESRNWLAPFLDALSIAGPRILELGSGEHYADSAVLSERGFTLLACDRRPAHTTSLSVHAFAADISRPLPVRTAAVDTVLASLSLHYFTWATTVEIFAEIHRVLRPGGALLFRVNAADDLNYGAGIGDEIEPGYFRSDGRYGAPCKRFFTEDTVRAALTDLFEVSHLEHRSSDRYGATKQVWECLAHATSATRGPGWSSNRKPA